MDAEKKTPTRTEREAGMKRGYLSQVKVGKIRVPSPETIRDLADYLRVSYEWLAIGRGPMRADNWAPTTFEEAAIFARRHGISDAAIEATIAQLRTDAPISAPGWIVMFVALSTALPTARMRAESGPQRVRPRRRGAA